MKNITKFLITSLIVATLFAVLLVPSLTKAATTEELQKMIASLLAQIQQLQAQLAQQTGGTTKAWCHDFNRNIRIGDSGSEVSELQTALSKEGFSGKAKGQFDESTASAVSEFQENYADDILTPNGLKRGSGFVGPSTRAKLNKLYGCKGRLNTFVPTPTETSIMEVNPSTTTVTTPTPTQTTPVCAQVITPAKNYSTGECKEFSTPCNVPSGWTKVSSCLVVVTPPTVSVQTPTASIQTNNINPKTGDMVTISWSSTNASYCTGYGYNFNGQWSPLNKKPTSGTETFNFPSYTGTTAIDVGIQCWASEYGANASKKVSFPVPFIMITSPNGGETFTVGGPQYINFKTNAIKGRVYAQLFRGDVKVEDISYSDITNDGYQSNSIGWNIAGNHSLGSDWKIRLMLADSFNAIPIIADFSDASFSIVGTANTWTSISILSPSLNRGEDWKLGEAHTITWSASNAPSDAVTGIALVNQSTGANEYVLSAYCNENSNGCVNINDGSYTVLPSQLPVAGTYRVRLWCATANSDRYCTADGTKNSNPYVEHLGSNSFTISAIQNQPTLTISADPVQPNMTLAVQGAQRLPFTKVKLTASTEGDVSISGITVSTGEGSTASYNAISHIIALDENGNRLGIKSGSSGLIPINLTIPAGQSKAITIVANMSVNLSQYSGFVLSLPVTGVSTKTTLSGSLPVIGTQHTTNSSLTVGNLTMQKDITNGKLTFTNGSVEKIRFKKVLFSDTGLGGTVKISGTNNDGYTYSCNYNSDNSYTMCDFGDGIVIDKGLGMTLSLSVPQIVVSLNLPSDVFAIGETYGYGIYTSGN